MDRIAQCLQREPRTPLLFDLSLLVWSPIYSSFHNFILTIEFVLKLILKVSCFVALILLQGSFSSFERTGFRLQSFCRSFTHVVRLSVGSNKCGAKNIM